MGPRLVRLQWLFPAAVTIQTGDQSEDELFTGGDIVFTTIDQLLSAYIHMPLSLPNRLANVNAGALVGSLIVFDGSVLHGHLTNLTNTPRRSIQGAFIPRYATSAIDFKSRADPETLGY